MQLRQSARHGVHAVPSTNFPAGQVGVFADARCTAHIMTANEKNPPRPPPPHFSTIKAERPPLPPPSLGALPPPRTVLPPPSPIPNTDSTTRNHAAFPRTPPHVSPRFRASVHHSIATRIAKIIADKYLGRKYATQCHLISAQLIGFVGLGASAEPLSAPPEVLGATSTASAAASPFVIPVCVCMHATSNLKREEL